MADWFRVRQVGLPDSVVGEEVLAVSAEQAACEYAEDVFRSSRSAALAGEIEVEVTVRAPDGAVSKWKVSASWRPRVSATSVPS